MRSYNIAVVHETSILGPSEHSEIWIFSNAKKLIRQSFPPLAHAGC